MDHVSAWELRLWPLVHGSLSLHAHVNTIRKVGLQAPSTSRKGLNTFWYDEALGRHKYVFLEPPRLRGGYGLGSFLLVDPVVLQGPGVRYALRDVGEIVRQIDWFLGDTFHEFPEWVQEPGLLKEIISTERLHTERELLKRGIPADIFELVLNQGTLKRVIGSEAFKRYLDGYEFSATQFFNAIEQKCIELGYTLWMYLERDWEWPLSEEILVPEKVNPEHLLGYWNGEKWTEWASAKDRDTAVRVECFIDRLATARQ